MDERQKQIRGRIFMQACIGMIVVMLAIAFSNDFNIIDFDSFMDISDVMICLSLLLITYISCAMIWSDAYFGVFSEHEMKVCLVVFTVLAIAQDCFMVLDFINKEGFSAVSICSLVMINSITLGFWVKQKSWKA